MVKHFSHPKGKKWGSYNPSFFRLERMFAKTRITEMFFIVFLRWKTDFLLDMMPKKLYDIHIVYSKNKLFSAYFLLYPECKK